ncbi:phosphoribosyltransferase [Brenneria goodwinii]|uniref:phosphoribosyltransferase n=1 Tax=Brenneria goodwinii TaxID=1109412 RepID=UPI0036F22AE7
MKVITALETDFHDLCDELSLLVKKNYTPDIIVGIATGGEVVAQSLSKHFKVPLIIIKRQRNLTKYKSKFHLSKFLPYLPRSLNNFLRICEIKFNEKRFLFHNKLWDPCDVILKSGDVSLLSGVNKILIVDDSVDSGSTMVDCIDFIRLYADETAILKTASLNVTFSEPVITPDFFLYKDVLIRFPWSNDVG